MRIISYYTKDTPYEAEAAKLADSLAKVGVTDYSLVGVEDLKDWQLNVQHRPRVILEQLAFWDEDLLVVDADATFDRLPDYGYLGSLDCDLAAHVMDKGYWGQDTSKRSYSLMAGTLVVRNTEKARQLMEEWLVACQKSCGRVWDMRILEKLVGFDCRTKQVTGDYKFAELPVEYCAIDRTMPSVPGAIIRHHQASRRLKRKIK